MELDNPFHVGDPSFFAIQGLRCILGQDGVFCAGNASNNGNDKTPPTVLSISPTDSSTNISVTNLISVTFSEKIQASTLTAQSADGTCSGSFQVSTDNFTTCLGGTLTTSSNPVITFAANPNLCVGNTYQVKITTAAKDEAGNALLAAYTSSGFATQNPSLGSGVSGGSGNVLSFAISCNTLFIGGNFTMVNGQTRGNIASIDLLTGSTTSWDPTASNNVNELAVSGNTLYVGGAFTTIGGSTRNRIAAYDIPSGTLSTTWNPNINVGSIINVILPVGNIVYVGGSFSQLNSGAALRNNIAAIDASTGIATSWNPNATTMVQALVYSGGVMYVSGQFTTIGGQARNYVGAVDISTGTATSWNPGLVGGAQVTTLALSQNNTIFIGGNFTNSTGCTRNLLQEVDITTGTNCTSFDATMSGTSLNSIVLSSDAIFLGGIFTNSGGQPRVNLSSVATYDSSDLGWNPSPNNVTANLSHLPDLSRI